MRSIYVVTGASEFLGSAVVRKLIERGETVRTLRLPGDQAPIIKSANCRVYEGDVTEIETLEGIFTKTAQDELIVIRGDYDFVDVRDVAEGILSADERGRNGECYILSNRWISVRELVDLTCQYSRARRVRLTLS